MIQIKKATRNRPKGKDKLKVEELITSAISHFKAAVDRLAVCICLHGPGQHVCRREASIAMKGHFPESSSSGEHN